MSNDNDPTKDMSPFGAALFNCFRSANPIDQLSALNKLERKLADGECDAVTSVVAERNREHFRNPPTNPATLQAKGEDL